MSEVNENLDPETLVEEVTDDVDDSEVVPYPIDPTLTIQGEAADAKATGDAIAAVLNGVTINGKSATNKAFTVLAGDINMSSDQGAQTVAQAIQDAAGKKANDIVYETIDGTNKTIKQVVDGIRDGLDEDYNEEEIADLFDEVFGGDE